MKNVHLTRALETGLTIIELMTVVIVVGVVIAIAAPSMRGMMARQRVQSVQADLLTDLQLARSEMAQRSGSSTKVAVTFGGDAAVSCYTVHVDVTGTGTTCDCTRGPGTACTPALVPPPEIKTTQLTRAVGVSLAASSASGTSIVFAPPQGTVTPTDMVIDLQDTTSGHLRTWISGLGVPIVCSPDGSMRGVNPC
jgi:type IV fimbrial biogenesis protein FimT